MAWLKDFIPVKVEIGVMGADVVIGLIGISYINESIGKFEQQDVEANFG